jgi:pimeloyl-ACP methyl ester carboxylesterase
LPGGCSIHTNSLRKYGEPPFIAAVVHGGPGARGEMGPVARELSPHWGVLEPLQTAASLKGQVEELREVLEENGNLPVTLIGFSWGAWLGIIFSARFPAFVRKLIVIGCGGLEDTYGAQTLETRINRLNQGEGDELISLTAVLDSPGDEVESVVYARLGELLLRTDAYNPLVSESGERESTDFRVDIFRNVWREAAELRRSGKLLKLARSIRCPVVAIHGDYDPHPACGVQGPLSAAIKTFRFVLLKNCGHMPWIEKEARETFYRIVEEELP